MNLSNLMLLFCFVSTVMAYIHAGLYSLVHITNDAYYCNALNEVKYFIHLIALVMTMNWPYYDTNANDLLLRN